MNSRMQKQVSFITIIFLLISCVFVPGTAVWAESTGGSSARTGTYSYTCDAASNIQEEDTFVYRDDYFQHSSFLEDDALLTLSSQASLASASRFGDKVDPYEKDASKSGENITNMLDSMGFRDVEVNGYYGIQPMEHSGACAIGHRAIEASGKNYTLLALIPRSFGYKQEWAGNFTIGDGNVPTGFKAARDEDLRFLKQYIRSRRIQGDLKIWIAGHSRGAAIANLLGGFLAGGGAAYLGASVNIAPEDIYCYTFANPLTLKDGTSRNEVFSVEGARGGAYAEYDSPGEAWPWTEGGTIHVSDSVYKGIRNYAFSYDFITGLPPEEWHYTSFGQNCDIRRNNTVKTEDMVKELEKFSPFAYKQFAENDGDFRDFRYMTFDLLDLETKEVEGTAGGEGMAEYVNSLIHGLAAQIGEGNYESSGDQTALTALAGVFGMTFLQFTEEYIEAENDSIMPGIQTYLAYASYQLQKEGRADDDAEASAIVLKELLEYATGETIDPEHFTVDDFVVLFARYIADHEDSKLVGELKETAEPGLKDRRALIKGVLGIFHEKYGKEDWDQVTAGDVIVAVVRACAYGAAEGTEAYENPVYRDPEKMRKKMLYPVIPLLSTDVAKIIGADGSKSFRQAVADALPLILKGEDANGKKRTYATLAEAADAGLIRVMDETVDRIFRKISQESIYDDAYVSMLRGHYDTARENMSRIRTILCAFLFGSDIPYDTEYVIQRIATFAGNSGRIPSAHYNEVYTAWAKAREATPVPIDISGAEITTADTVYTGKARCPVPAVKLNGMKLKTGTDYTVTYRNNKKVGTAELAIEGIGKYTGTAQSTFRILPKKAQITSVKGVRKGFVVKWKKQTVQTTGYQIQYSTKKNFRSASKVTIRKNSITEKKIKKLKKKQTCYVRVRTYTMVDGRNYYSGWSAVKKVRTKR